MTAVPHCAGDISLHTVVRVEFSDTVVIEHKPERVIQPCRHLAKNILGKQNSKVQRPPGSSVVYVSEVQ